MISTMAASLPLEGPSLTRTTRPTSTNRLKVGASDDCIVCRVGFSVIDGGLSIVAVDGLMDVARGEVKVEQ